MTKEEKYNAAKGLIKYSKLPKSEEWLKNNRDRQCPDNFICKLNDEILFETRYRKDMYKWIRENLGLSREISEKLIKKTWKPTFNKHLKFENLEIIIEKDKFKSLSTNPDECKDVE